MKRDKMAESRCSAQSGFTLVEVLMVVAILGLLAGVVAAKFSGHGRASRIKTTRASIAAIETALDMYEVDTGRLPSNLSSLFKSDGAANWNGPYLKKDTPADSWGTPFAYSVSDNSYKITSGGPDMTIGGSDDITN